MIKYYIIPLIEDANHPQGPTQVVKYIATQNYPTTGRVDLIGRCINFRLKTLGLDLLAVAIIDTDGPTHDLLADQPDVFQFPDNVDQPIGDYTKLNAVLSVSAVGSFPVRATTYRRLFRKVSGLFEAHQVYNSLPSKLIEDGDDLLTPVRQLPREKRRKLVALFDRMGVDKSEVRPDSMTLEDVLALLVNQFDDRIDPNGL